MDKNEAVERIAESLAGSDFEDVLIEVMDMQANFHGTDKEYAHRRMEIYRRYAAKLIALKDSDDMPSEVDFTGGERGKYAK